MVSTMRCLALRTYQKHPILGDCLSVGNAFIGVFASGGVRYRHCQRCSCVLSLCDARIVRVQ